MYAGIIREWTYPRLDVHLVCHIAHAVVAVNLAELGLELLALLLLGRLGTARFNFALSPG